MKRVVLLAAAIWCAAAWGQDYPGRPVRIIAGSAGGAVDFTSRVVAQNLPKLLGQPVVVENRGGGGGAVAITSVANAPPDGYTILAYSSAVWIGPLLKDDPGWDALRDFAPITIADRTPNMIVVHPSLPVKRVKELIALARARPRELNYASVGSGSGAHLSAELFKFMTRTDMVHVPYKGIALGLTDLVGGRVQIMFAFVGIAMPHVAARRLRALAVTSAEPSVLAPGLPTVSASGVPGYESIQTFGILAPAKVPRSVIERLNRDIVHVLMQPESREKLLATGLEVVANTPEEAAATIKGDIARMGKVIKAVGIRAD